MAKDKIDVEQLEKLRKSWGFGSKGTKTPNKENEESQRSEDQLIYTQMIMGSLATMIWGEQNVKQANKFKSLLGNKNNIYNLVKNINTIVDNKTKSINVGLSKDTIKIIDESLKNITKKINVNLSEDTINVINESLKNSTDTLAQVIKGNINTNDNNKKSDDQKVKIELTNIDNIQQIIDELKNEKIKLFDFDNIQQIIDELKNEKIKLFDFDNIQQTIDELKNEKIKLFDFDNASNIIKEIENAIEKLKDIEQNILKSNIIPETKESQIKDSLIKILIEIDNVKTIEGIIESFHNLQSYPFFDNDNINKVESILNLLKELSEPENKIWLIVDFKDLEQLQKDINEKLKFTLYDDDLKQKLIDLKDEINKGLPINLFNELNISNVANLIDEINAKDKINIFDVQSINNIKDLLESVRSLSKDVTSESILQGLQDLLDDVDNLKPENIEKGKKKISTLISFINEPGKNSVQSLLQAIEGLKISKKDTLKSLSDAFIVINSVTKLMEGCETQINKKFFKDLNIVLTGDDYIKGLVNKLNTLAVDIDKKVNNNIKIVNAFVSIISNLGNIGLVNLIKSKITIKAINDFFVKDIRKLINNILQYKVIDKDYEQTFETLNNLFNSISKLCDINITNQRKMIRNIVFIDKYISGDIKNLLSKSIPSLDEDQKYGFEVLDKIRGIIDSLIGIGDIDIGKIDNAQDKIGEIEDFVTNNINEFLKKIYIELSSKEYINKIIELTDLTKEVFENIGKMNDSIPSIMSLGKANIKMTLLAVEFAFMEESFKTLSKIPKILSNNDKQFLLNRFDGVIDSIITINGLIASINTVKDIKNIIEFSYELKFIEECMNLIKKIDQSFIKTITFIKFKKSIENIISVINNIEVTKDTYKKLDSITALLNALYLLGQYTSDSTKFDVEKFDEATGAIISGAIPFISEFTKDSELDKNLKDLISVNKSTLEKFDQIIKLIEKFDKLSKIAVLSKVSNIGLKGIVQEAEYIKVIIGKFNDIDSKAIKKAEKSLDLFKKLVIMSAAILLVGALVMKVIKIEDLVMFTLTLTVFLFAITTTFIIVAKSLKPAMEGAKGAVLLIAASAFVLIAGSLAMYHIDLGNLLLFTGTLSIFLFTISGIFRLFSKGFKKSLDGAKDAVILIAASAFIMLLGAKLVEPELFVASLLFTVELGVFLTAIGLAFSAWKKFNPKSIMASAEDLCLIIGISAIALILGGIVSDYVGIGDLLMFTIELTVLIAGTVGIFMAASKFTPDALKSAKDIALLIGVSGLIMIAAGVLASQMSLGWLVLFEIELAVLIGGVLGLYALASMIPVEKYIELGWELSLLVAVSGLTLVLAGLFVKYIDLVSLFLFTLILGAFVAAILFVYSIASKGFKSALKGAQEVIILIGASAAILIFGTLVVQKWVDIPSLIAFTLLLGGFIFAITYAYVVFGKHIQKSLVPAIALALLTAISGLVLIMGGKYILDNPGLLEAVTYFAIILISYIALMGTVCALLGKFMPKILMGIVAMGLLLLVTSFATSVINKIATVASQEGFLMNILKGVGAIAGVIVAIGGIAFAAGALVMGPQALVFAAGVAVMATISGLALLASQAVKNIADAMIHMKEVEKFDPAIMIENIQGFISIAKEIEPIAESFTTIMKASIAITTMSYALSSIAMTLKDWSDLKIPIYAGTEIVGYETITSNMFNNAAENIKAVVTTLAQAILDIYNKAPEGMFEPALLGLFGPSPFSKVVTSIKIMGPMLSSIADAIKDWANLRIPEYTGTKITGYKTITKGDFRTAADNIKEVVKTLAQAIIDVYLESKKKPNTKDMFEPEAFGLFGKSIFSKVTTSLKTMGPMLSSIADAVKDWADLKIPIYTGKEITGYVTIRDQEIEDAAEHIQAVILTLGSGIIAAYEACQANEDTKDMFEPDGYLGLGKSKFAKIANSFKTMGSMLSSIAEGVKEWVDLKIPTYTGTKHTGYLTLKDTEFNIAAENIKKVLVCIGEALIETVKDNDDIFGDNMFTDGPAIVAANAMKIMGETLNLTAEAVAAYASNRFPIYNKDGTFSGKLMVIKETDYTNASANIQKVLTCIGHALIDVVEKNKDIFNDGLFSDAPAIKAAEAVKLMSEALNNSVVAITSLSKLDLNEIHKALDRNGPDDNIYHRLNDLLTFTADIYKLFIAKDNDLAVEETVSHWWGSDTTEKMSFAEYLNEHNKDIEKANEALGKFIDMIEDIIDKFSSVGKSFNENIDNLSVLSNVHTLINSSMVSFANIINLLINNTNKEIYKNISNNKKIVKDGIDDGSKLINNLLSNILSISKSYDKIKDFDLLVIKNYINKFVSCINALKTISNNVDNTDVKVKIPNLDTTILFNQIKAYTSAIKLIISISEYAQSVGEEGYNILRDGILKVYNVTKKICLNTGFSNHASDLEKYIQTINSIDLSKVNGLQNFINSLNALSSRLGNLDKLTDALANNLTRVLLELVNQLRMAETSIKNAHELQERRKKLIEESIEKVKSLMANPMTVEISQRTDDQQQEQNSGGYINGNAIDSTSAQGTDDNQGQSSYNDLQSPEQLPKKSNENMLNQQNNNGDILTMTEFVRLMEVNMKGWGDK